MMRKLFNFPDKNIDRQVIEIITESNTSFENLLVPDLVTDKKYRITVEVADGVPQLVLTEQ